MVEIELPLTTLLTLIVLQVLVEMFNYQVVMVQIMVIQVEMVQHQETLVHQVVEEVLQH